MKTQTQTQVVVLLAVLFLGFTVVFKREEYGTDMGTDMGTPQGTSEGTESGSPQGTESGTESGTPQETAPPPPSPPPVVAAPTQSPAQKPILPSWAFWMIVMLGVVALLGAFYVFSKSDYAKKLKEMNRASQTGYPKVDGITAAHRNADNAAVRNFMKRAASGPQ